MNGPLHCTVALFVCMTGHYNYYYSYYTIVNYYYTCIINACKSAYSTARKIVDCVIERLKKKPKRLVLSCVVWCRRGKSATEYQRAGDGGGACGAGSVVPDDATVHGGTVDVHRSTTLGEGRCSQ